MYSPHVTSKEKNLYSHHKCYVNEMVRRYRARQNVTVPVWNSTRVRSFFFKLVRFDTRWEHHLVLKKRIHLVLIIYFVMKIETKKSRLYSIGSKWVLIDGPFYLVY